MSDYDYGIESVVILLLYYFRSSLFIHYGINFKKKNEDASMNRENCILCDALSQFGVHSKGPFTRWDL